MRIPQLRYGLFLVFALLASHGAIAASCSQPETLFQNQQNGTTTQGVYGQNLTSSLLYPCVAPVDNLGNIIADDATTFARLTEVSPSASATIGIVPGVGTQIESSHIIKASSGNLYSLQVQTAGTQSGCVMLFNSTTVPNDGAVQPAMAPVAVTAGTLVTVNIDLMHGGPPAYFSTGIVAAFSSTCGLTKTASATALFSWLAK